MAHAAQPATLTSTQIVDEMQRRNQARANGLKARQLFDEKFDLSHAVASWEKLVRDL